MIADELLAIADVNGRLPLVRSIVRDIVALHADIESRRERFAAMPGRGEKRSAAGSVAESVYDEEVRQLQDELRRDLERLGGFAEELHLVGGVLGDAQSGAVDFPFEMDGERVWLCWHPEEPAVTYWHAGACGESERIPLDSAIEGVSR